MVHAPRGLNEAKLTVLNMARAQCTGLITVRLRLTVSTLALVPTCLVENLIDDMAAVREVVFPRENGGRDLDQKALCG